MQGFDAEFSSLDTYIRVITDRIWEGGRLEDIYRYYSADCAVETPVGVTIGVEAIVAGTRATLAAFPDRRLLAEDIIVSGDETTGYLSSHRIFSPMTHAGPGPFGAPTNRSVFVRTIADCVCYENRIVHEWLVRDQSAIARQIGCEPRQLARAWLAARAKHPTVVMPPVPAPYRSEMVKHPDAARFAAGLEALWANQPIDPCAGALDPQLIAALPGGEVAVGAHAYTTFWHAIAGCFDRTRFAVEHLTVNERPGRATAVAARWRVTARHAAPGRFGPPTHRDIEMLAISHGEFTDGRATRHWHLLDEVAIWMQILAPHPRASP